MKAKVFLFFVLTTVFLQANSMSEKEEIVTTIQHFFDSMENRNINEVKKVLIPEGFTFAVRKEGDTETFKTSDFREFINSLTKLNDKYTEVLSNPVVLVQDGIAVLWTKYDFYRNGKFSHCGIDAFNLVKIHDHWKIAGLVYTISNKGCSHQNQSEKKSAK